MFVRIKEKAKTIFDTEYEIVLENLSKEDKEKLLKIEKDGSFNKIENIKFIEGLLKKYGEILSSEESRYFYDFKLKEIIGLDLDDEEI